MQFDASFWKRAQNFFSAKNIFHFERIVYWIEQKHQKNLNYILRVSRRDGLFQQSKHAAQ